MPSGSAACLRRSARLLAQEKGAAGPAGARSLETCRACPTAPTASKQLGCEAQPAESGPAFKRRLPGRKANQKALPSRCVEAELRSRGYESIAGVDEAGRGPLAGPVVAAACCIPADVLVEGINDSKKLSAGQREQVFEALIAHPRIATATYVAEPQLIDKINILQATLLAMRHAVDQLEPAPDFVLVDGTQLPTDLDPETCRAVVGGDGSCTVIAAASIIAKVTRDRIMSKYHDIYPQYGFADHKGYGTAKHIQAIKDWGPCEIHRMSFAPMRSRKQAA